MLKANGCFRSVKGVSNLVSAVVLIVFVVSLGLIVTGWGQKLISKGIDKSQTKVGTSLECGNVQIRLEKFLGGEDWHLVLKNNNKDKLRLEGFISRFIMKNTGNAFVDYTNQNKKVENFGAVKLVFGDDQGVYKPKDQNGVESSFTWSSVDVVEIIPRADIGEGEIVDCENKKVMWKA